MFALGGCQRWNFDASPKQAFMDSYYMAPFAAAVTFGRVRARIYSKLFTAV